MNKTVLLSWGRVGSEHFDRAVRSLNSREDSQLVLPHCDGIGKMTRYKSLFTISDVSGVIF